MYIEEIQKQPQKNKITVEKQVIDKLIGKLKEKPNEDIKDI